MEENSVKGATLRKYKGLFIRLELDPDRLPQYRKLGELKTVVEEMTGGEIQAKFAPDFALYIKLEAGAQLLAQIRKNG